MRKIFYLLSMLIIVSLSSIALVSCGDSNDEDDEYIPPTEQEEAQNLSKPTLKKILTTTTTTDVSFRCRFDNGGDDSDNMSCTVHWKTFASKQDVTPDPSSLTKSESMRQYGSTSTTTTFDRSHSGFSGGDRIYYYFECKNSKYTTKTDVLYCIVKR